MIPAVGDNEEGKKFLEGYKDSEASAFAGAGQQGRDTLFAAEKATDIPLSDTSGEQSESSKDDKIFEGDVSKTRFRDTYSKRGGGDPLRYPYEALTERTDYLQILLDLALEYFHKLASVYLQILPDLCFRFFAKLAKSTRSYLRIFEKTGFWLYLGLPGPLGWF